MGTQTFKLGRNVLIYADDNNEVIGWKFVNADAKEGWLDDPDWITVENGQHVPLDETGTVAGGAGGSMKGKVFSNAKSQKNKKKTFSNAKSQKSPSAQKKSQNSPQSAPKGLDVSYTGSVDAAKKFNQKLYELHPEAFGSEADFDDNVRTAYERRFGSAKFLYESNGGEGNEYGIKKLPYAEWEAADNRWNSFVDYDDFKKNYLLYRNELAAEGSVVEGLTLYEHGANKKGYGRTKNGRKEFDERFRISKFIDGNPNVHYSGGTLYRGVKSSDAQIKQVKKALEKGEAIDMCGCSSWTTREDIAKDFCKYSLMGSSKAKPVVFVEEGNKERNAMPYPYSSTGMMIQNEVLYSGSAKFKPTRIEEKEGAMYVYVEAE